MNLRVLGAMTGTSCDGLDASCLEFSDSGKMRTLWSDAADFPLPLRKKILKFQTPESRWTLLDLLKTERDLSRWYASSFLKMIRTHQEKPDLIANHGQTIAHHPNESVTLQLGLGPIIAQATGLSTVTQFRLGDMTAQGQGAPLAPLFHQWLLRGVRSSDGLSIHNLGGISNLSYFKSTNLPPTFAFDTGPGNIWIDEAASRASRGRLTYDKDGSLSQKGVPDLIAVQKIIKKKYFKLAPPKSTGRDDFSFTLLTQETNAQGVDLVATALEVTAQSIANAYLEFVITKKRPLSTIYFSGGGVKNLTLMRRIRELLPTQKIHSMEVLGLDSQKVEAQAFAYFGFLSALGRPLGGAWTGVRGFAPPGTLTPGKNWAALLKKIQHFTK